MKCLHILYVRRLAGIVAVILFAAGLAGCGAAGTLGSPGTGGTNSTPAPQLTGARIVHSFSAPSPVTDIDLVGPGGAQSTHPMNLQPGQEVFIPLAAGNYSATFWVYVGNNFSMMDLTPRHFFVSPNQTTVVNYP